MTENPESSSWHLESTAWNPESNNVPWIPLHGATMEVKSVGTFSVILLKLANPPLPPQSKFILSKMGGRPQHCWEKLGGRRDELKAKQKIVVRRWVLRNNYLEGLFHTVASSFVLHCRCRTDILPCKQRQKGMQWVRRG